MNRMRFVTTALLAVGMGGSLLMPMAAQASVEGRRNTTYALGALTAVLAAKGQTIPAVITGIGTVIADQNLQNEIDARYHPAEWYGDLHDARDDHRDVRDDHRGFQSDRRDFRDDRPSLR